MPLDRTWYNTLVDDDGSGMTGSVWDKADVDALMDAIDVELAALGSGIPSSGSFVPTLIGAGGGTPSYSLQVGRYTRSGKTIHVGGQLSITSKGSLSGALSIGGFPATAMSAGQQAGLSIGYWGGLSLAINFMSAYINGGDSKYNLTITSGGGGTASALLDSSHLSAAVQLIFGGVYQSS